MKSITLKALLMLIITVIVPINAYAMFTLKRACQKRGLNGYGVQFGSEKLIHYTVDNRESNQAVRLSMSYKDKPLWQFKSNDPAIAAVLKLVEHDLKEKDDTIKALEHKLAELSHQLRVKDLALKNSLNHSESLPHSFFNQEK